jgi:hypothetical protein
MPVQYERTARAAGNALIKVIKISNCYALISCIRLCKVGDCHAIARNDALRNIRNVNILLTNQPNPNLELIQITIVQCPDFLFPAIFVNSPHNAVEGVISTIYLPKKIKYHGF